MKTKLLNLFLAITALAWFGCQPPQDQGIKVTFQLDMTGVEMGAGDTVGIRGDVAPLSWTETYPMDGPDEKGIYSVTIPFDDADYGTRLQYKYYYGDDNWDNDRYQQFGNRVATICCSNQVQPLDTWNKLEDFALESLLESAVSDELGSSIFTVAMGKKRGLTLEEIGLEIAEFWYWPENVPPSPEEFLIREKFYQALHTFGYFEVIENSPDKAEYIINKNWETRMLQWSDDGNINGVTPDDLTTVYKTITAFYAEKANFKLDWSEEPDSKVRITITR